ncbi:nicotinate phosphoribosyltransferase [Algicola sagamiensis]|uniref:nicotinate phosphoribosyltransferase n=1 Tax=Algicola sagamiensis TaxID=163869 RepID=UPI000364862F|nr:nicotinate phosphoribosyltransferase [Algicola sagamiensis]
MKTSIILNADSYKASHYLQYPEHTSVVSSYIEPRGGKFDKVLFFGLQAFLKEYLCHPITQADIDEGEQVITAHGLPFNRAGWEYILEHHDGYLPLEIEAVPEGSLIDNHNVLLQVRNTDPKCYWLTSYVETALLRSIWYPSTVATQSFHIRQVLQDNMRETCATLDKLPFMLHDFGARGATTFEASCIGGMAHLVSFQGTDTMSALMAARRYYSAEMAGYSVPAAEHSTITTWGKDGEREAYENMLRQFSKPGALVSVVSDSYDLWYAIDQIWGNDLKQAIQESGGTLVIRPDSGDPVTVVRETIQRLMGIFGYELVNGYRVLPECIRVIQGDGITYNSIQAILDSMKEAHLSADNVVFGMGGALLQKLDRDTLQWAMKASAVCVNGIWRDVYKDPVTDHGKRSKRGLLALIEDPHQGHRTIRKQDLNDRENLLRTVYRNGQLLIEHTFEAIRERALKEKN